jgi:type I restriction enzyme S subunit
VADYPIVKVGSLADSISNTHKMEKDLLIFLNTSDILHGKFLHRDYTLVRDWPGQAKKSISKDDILFSEIRPANGRWAYVDEDSDDFVVSTKLMVIRARRNKVLPRYLYRFLTSSDVAKWLQHLAESRSGTFPQITFDQVSSLEIPLPPLTEQKAIAAVLGLLDDKIELNQQMNATLEGMARAMFRSWFVDFDPVRAKLEGCHPAGLDKATAALFPTAFQDSPFGLIPQGWEVRTIETICKTVTRGITPAYQEGSGRFIINQRVNRGSDLDWSSLKELSSELNVPPDRYAKRWDVLVNCLGEGTLGRTHLYKGESDIYAIDQHMSVCRAGHPSGGAYIYQVLSGVDGQARIESLKTGSTGMTMLNISALRAFDLAWPTENLVAAYFQRVEPLWLQIANNDHQSRTLAILRDTLLPRFLAGEISVVDAERAVGILA